jgi:hypothetical protein
LPNRRAAEAPASARGDRESDKVPRLNTFARWVAIPALRLSVLSVAHGGLAVVVIAALWVDSESAYAELATNRRFVAGGLGGAAASSIALNSARRKPKD